jgi:hypothetical protein
MSLCVYLYCIVKSLTFIKVHKNDPNYVDICLFIQRSACNWKAKTIKICLKLDTEQSLIHGTQGGSGLS